MHTFTDLALTFALVFFGLLLVLVPVALWIQFRHRSKFFPRPLVFEELPSAARDFFQPKVDAIGLWGFDLVTYLSVEMSGAGSETFIALLSNPHTNEWADVSYDAAGAAPRAYMEFVTYCSDEIQVDTNTSPHIPVLFAAPNHHVFRFPQIQDVFTLYRVHRMLVPRNLNGGRSVLPPRGQEMAELQRRLERYGPWQQSRGYMRLDADGKFYRLTLKGAVLGGLRSIWPIPSLRAWRLKTESESILRKIGVAQ